MVFWFIEFNYINVVITLIISLTVVIFAIVLFKFWWLDLPELKIPTTYFKDEYKFGSDIGFFAKMRILILDILNQDYWINHIGFDGTLIRLLFFAISSQNHSDSSRLFSCVFFGFPILLSSRENHEYGLH